MCVEERFKKKKTTDPRTYPAFVPLEATGRRTVRNTPDSFPPYWWASESHSTRHRTHSAGKCQPESPLSGKSWGISSAGDKGLLGWRSGSERGEERQSEINYKVRFKKNRSLETTKSTIFCNNLKVWFKVQIPTLIVQVILKLQVFRKRKLTYCACFQTINLICSWCMPGFVSEYVYDRTCRYTGCCISLRQPKTRL